jgi:hypothetical protein
MNRSSDKTKSKPSSVSPSGPTRFSVWRSGEDSWCVRHPSGIIRYNLTRQQVIAFLETEMRIIDERD